MNKKTITTLLVTLLLIFATTLVYAGDQEDAYESAMIIKLVDYVTWAASGGPEAGQPLVIGVVGDVPLFDRLEKTAAFASTDPKPVVKKITADNDLAGIHFLFIPSESKDALDGLLQIAQEKSILTIADTDGLGEAGVVLNFYADGAKVKFEVNLASAKAKGLKISSKLLKLARIIG